MPSIRRCCTKMYKNKRCKEYLDGWWPAEEPEKTVMRLDKTDLSIEKSLNAKDVTENNLTQIKPKRTFKKFKKRTYKKKDFFIEEFSEE